MRARKLKRIVLVGFLALLLPFVWLACSLSPAVYTSVSGDSNPDLVITGHRDAAGLAPENTLSSVRLALEYPVDRVEIDVQQSSDGVVIVMHDETVDRTTDGSGAVGEMTWAELQELRVLDAEGNVTEEGVPSLGAVLDAVEGRRTLVIEVKCGGDCYPGIEERIVELVRARDAAAWCIVHSFNDAVLERVHGLMPELRLHKLLVVQARGLPLVFDGGFGWGAVEEMGYVEEISIMWQFANRGFVDAVHAAGKKVNVWTVNGADDAADLVHLGVDGLITDRPDVVVKGL